MIVEIDISTVLHSASGSAVPLNLASYIDQNQWNAVTNSIRGAHSQATALACLLELGCCIVFAFPCIFCCHPFVVGITSQDAVRGSLRQLNSAYFNGVDVLSSNRTGFFTVNTDKIHRSPPVAQVQYLPQQLVPVSQVAYYGQPQSYPVYGQPVYGVQSQPSYPQPQSYSQPPAYAPQQYYNTPQDQYHNPTGNDINAPMTHFQGDPSSSPSSSSLYGSASASVHPYPATAPPYESVPHAVPMNAQPLSEFLLTIPPGASEGSNITVVNPHGVTMLVTVPPGAQPGSQILIKYQV
eukprot:gene22539-29187_t